MNFAWLKRYMPRGLYQRAALILILPIVTLQLVVSIVFLQRHFEGVTEQMTRNVVVELQYIVDLVNTAPNAETAQLITRSLGEPLQYFVEVPGEAIEGDSRLFYDLTGKTATLVLHDSLDTVQGIDLKSDDKWVHLSLESRHGPVEVRFARRRVTASNPHQLLVLTVATAVLMTIIAYLFLRNQLRPIKRLSDASAAFGRGQSVAYRPSGALEVRAAGQAFLDMRNRIERQIEQRTLLLSGVSHDLRTPLTRLKLGLSMMEDSEDVRALNRDVADMEQLLDAFLSFARGQGAEQPEATDPRALVERVVENAQRAGQKVSLGTVEAEGTALFRPVAVQRALENLVGNAVRYGTHCRVGLSMTERAAVFRVEDDGPGIAQEDWENALKPFSRLEPARNQNKGTGVGLGLSIALDIARSHGGTLRLGRSADLGGLQVDLVLAR
ncbi:ATP-binding protein [Pseudoruegeria sp. SHC-113]|uniref:ATP-binding protein n=1 Tax=Pseudoruegeria sp. SHC-113 TaxID=2855439 RepID=UPI0021BB1539|nr:ATP-binding protein [Pseudoruegeria sp. SHC-113]MCT8160643.1 HAMP domain-containing protein [Pseudoruegeria sp. SHC-113]